MLLTHGRAQAAVQALLDGGLGPHVDRKRLHWLPPLSQVDYDHLLWACDSNFVRGEDSLVRAIWAGKPWVWQIYPQDDGAHHTKLQALMHTAALPASWQSFHRQWNAGTPPATLAPYRPADWATDAAALRQRLMALPGLTNQLLAFVQARAPGPATAR